MKTGKKSVTVHTPLAVKNLAKYGKKAGDPLFELVENWLRDAHYFGSVGENCINTGALLSEAAGAHQTRNLLLNRFLVAVALCNHGEIRRIADAVKRVHARKEYIGDQNVSFPFHVPMVNPALAKLARNTVGTTLPTKAREISKTLSELGGPQISERTARRRRKDLGLKPGKPGRPRKTQK